MKKLDDTNKRPLTKEEQALLKLFISYHEELNSIGKKVRRLDRKVQKLFDRAKAKELLKHL